MQKKKILKNKVTKQDDRADLAARIKKARENVHISQKELGDSIGVSDKSISSYEKGRSVPPIKKLKKIAKTTNKPLSFFTEEETVNIDILGKLNTIEKEFQEIRELLKNISKNKNHS